MEGEDMILDTIAESTRRRVENAKDKVSIDDLKAMIFQGGKPKQFNGRESFSFEQGLTQKGISFICEVKKASPSKGVIAKEFPYLAIALEYEAAGANAISVLTEPEFFLGSDEYLKEISKLVSVPVLRKDFTIDEYQIYEAKVLGADAILLICALLDKDTIREYIKLCDQLGLSALVEAHDKEELETALAAGARVIGVNNRNLKTFEVSLDHCIHLRDLVPSEITYVAESGIHTEQDMARLRKAGVNAVLIGESLMRSTNKKEMLSLFRGI